MSPDAFAAKFPRLYHVAWPQARARIRRDGLMSPAALVEREGLPRDVLLAPRAEITDLGGGMILNDNSPLNLAVLRRALPDSLSVEDWLGELNRRVFLFPKEARARAFANAAAAAGKARDIWVFDTRGFAAAYLDRMDITPFNTGAAVRNAPLRDRTTFAPLAGLDFAEWRTRRQRSAGLANPDNVTEVCVRGSAPGAANYAVEVIERPPV